MTYTEQATALCEELDCLVSRYCNEFDLTVPTIIGCMEMVKYDLLKETTEE